MRYTLAAVATIAIVFAAIPVHGLQLNSETERRIDDVFSEYDRTDGPGCVVGIIRAGQLVYARGYGIGQLDHNVPLSTSSAFYLASVSKQFTAAAVLIAEAEGHLAVEDDIRTHIPEFPDYGTTITMEHLLHHTSGVRDYLALMFLSGIPFENIMTDGERLRLITRQKELNFEPGSEFSYSNSGYVLLAEIVKRTTGRSLRQYAEEKIFRPLGMMETHFHDDRTHVVPNRVFSYDSADDGTWRTNYLMNFEGVGDGGSYSTIEDLARWDRAFYEDALGIPGLASRMYTPAEGSEDVVYLPAPGVFTGDMIAYGYGLEVGMRRGLQRVAHGGGLMAFRAMIARYPQERTSSVVLCNVGSANISLLSTAVEDAVLDDVFPEEAEVPAPPVQERPGTRDQVTIPEATLRSLAGSYRSEELASVWVLDVNGSGLVLQHPSGRVIGLTPEAESRFTGSGLQLDFLREGESVEAFVLQTQRVRNVRFERESP